MWIYIRIFQNMQPENVKYMRYCSIFNIHFKKTVLSCFKGICLPKNKLRINISVEEVFFPINKLFINRISYIESCAFQISNKYLELNHLFLNYLLIFEIQKIIHWRIQFTFFVSKIRTRSSLIKQYRTVERKQNRLNIK